MGVQELTKDYLQYKIDHELHTLQELINTSCTMSTIRWLQRYAHCYSFICSLICFPFWLLVLPITVALDICIYTILLTVFIVIFILALLIAPCCIAYQFSSCADGCSPINIYRYSLLQALKWAELTYVCFQMGWQCYCGSGELDNGTPICCTYVCCTSCQRACTHATHVEINQPCTIL